MTLTIHQPVTVIILNHHSVLITMITTNYHNHQLVNDLRKRSHVRPSGGRGTRSSPALGDSDT